tara:strand:+ start:2671 stop:3684 length:1014 start_codon:yes stop_codon:yes gene_type:complete
MKVIYPLVAVLLLALVAYLGVAIGLEYLFGVIIPYVSVILFLGGFIWKIYDWVKSPVPFRIPTTCGQAKSLEWIKRDELESPSGFWGVFGRMSLEVLFFRSLFRNTKAELVPGPSLAYSSSKWLWMAGLIFHWSLLVIVLRHYRFFLAGVPGFVEFLESVDGFLQITLPTLYITDLLLVISVTFLVLRRLASAQMRIISLSTDYFPLFLILAIALSGISMRYLDKVDVVAIKVLVQGLVSFQFDAPGGIGGMFYVHLFLVCVLISYFPFSKLMHMGGIFLSPTRNLANNSREKRHINPWNPEVQYRTYAEYEDEFREKMVKADLPTEFSLPSEKEKI